MDGWSIGRYSRPYLAVDRVVLDAVRSLILLDAAGDHFSIACDDENSAADVQKVLQSLRDPSSRYWLEIRQQGELSTWFDLVSHLDNRCFIADAEEDDPDLWIERELDSIQEAIDATIADVVERAGIDKLRSIAQELSELIDVVVLLLRPSENTDNNRGQTGELCHRSPNFYIAALSLQACYMQRAAPISLIALREVLCGILDRERRLARTKEDSWREIARPLAGGLYSERDFRVHLS
jgi:hypothetical protein